MVSHILTHVSRRIVYRREIYPNTRNSIHLSSYTPCEYPHSHSLVVVWTGSLFNATAKRFTHTDLTRCDVMQVQGLPAPPHSTAGHFRFNVHDSDTNKHGCRIGYAFSIALSEALVNPFVLPLSLSAGTHPAGG